MFCTKCGTQINDNELYCKSCGGVNEYAQQLTQESTVQIAVNNDLSKAPKKKKGRCKVILLLLISLMVLVVVAGIVIKSLFFKTVEFDDEIIFMVVCDELGKKSGDKIYEHELEEIEVINIDDSYAVGRVLCDGSLGGYSVLISMNIDLTDLSKFENLKEVNIYNGYIDNIYNLEALAECEKLEKITMFYNTDSIMTSMGHGCKELVFIVENCPRLEYINTVVAIPDELKESILEINPDIKLEIEDEYIEQKGANHTTYYNVTSEGVIKDYTQDYIPLEEYLQTEPTSLRVGDISEEDWGKIAETESIRSLYVSSDFNVEYISDMDNLRCLTIAGYFSQGQMKTVKVDNVEALDEMKNIVSLSLIGCVFEGDLDAIGNMKNIRFLGYCGNEQVLPRNLECYESLYGFEYNYMSLDVSVEKYICDMRNLRKLTTQIDGKIDIDYTKKLNYLDVNNYRDDEMLDVSFVNDLDELNYLTIRNMTDSIVDWSNIGELDNLSVVNCKSKCINVSSLKECKNIVRAYFPLMQSYCDERLQGVTIDINELAELKYLSYFGLDYSTQYRVDWSEYGNIYGLKKMDDNGIFVNICIGKYVGGGYPDYEIDVYPNLR